MLPAAAGSVLASGFPQSGVAAHARRRFATRKLSSQCLEGELEDTLLCSQGSEPAGHGRRIVCLRAAGTHRKPARRNLADEQCRPRGVGAWCTAIEEQVTESHREEVPGAEGKGNVDAQHHQNLPDTGDVWHQLAARHEGGAYDHALHSTVQEDIQDARAEVMPEACQAARGLGALIHFAGGLAAQALELHRRVPEVAHVRLRGPLRQPGAHAAEAALRQALGQVVVVAQEGVIAWIARG